MRIGIIGAGQIGGTLTRRLAALGHDVRVSNSRTPDTLAELEAETGAKAVRSTEAAEGAELVIVSIPQKNVVDLPAGILSGAVAGAPVIETNNYYPQQRDGLISAIEDGQTESGWVQEHLGVPVFKAFNGIWWKHLLEKGASRRCRGAHCATHRRRRRREQAGRVRSDQSVGLRSCRCGNDRRFLASAAGNSGVRQGLRSRSDVEGIGRGEPRSHRRMARNHYGVGKRVAVSEVETATLLFVQSLTFAIARTSRRLSSSSSLSLSGTSPRSMTTWRIVFFSFSACFATAAASS